MCVRARVRACAFIYVGVDGRVGRLLRGHVCLRYHSKRGGAVILYFSRCCDIIIYCEQKYRKKYDTTF